MEKIIESVESAISSGNFYAAFVVSLTLPDICGDIEYPGMDSKSGYIKWLSTNLPEYIGHASGEECYALRCTILHNADDYLDEYKRRSFSPLLILGRFYLRSEGSHLIRLTDNYYNGVKLENVVALNTVEFSKDILKAVKDWLKKNKGNKKIQERLKKVFIIHSTPFQQDPIKVE